MKGRVSNHEFSDENNSTRRSIQLTAKAGSGHWTLRQEALNPGSQATTELIDSD